MGYKGLNENRIGSKLICAKILIWFFQRKIKLLENSGAQKGPLVLSTLEIILKK